MTRERVDDTDRHRWQEPGAYQVVPGIYRIPLPMPDGALRTVNVYVVEGDDGLTLIDAGWDMPQARAQLADALATLSYSVSDIRTVLVTHIHRDHYGQGPVLRRETACHLGLGEGERPSLELLHRGDPTRNLAMLALLRRHGADDLAQRLEERSLDWDLDPSRWEPPDEWIVDGQSFTVGRTTLSAMHTPGHTQGHLVYVGEDRGVIFTGDHVLPHITPSLGLEHRPGALPLRDYLESLRAVAKLPDLMMLPAHGPVRSTTRYRVHELLDHHEQRLDACQALLGPTPVSARHVAEGLPWTRRRRRLDELNDFNQLLAVSETAAHLDLLALWGRIHREEKSGTVWYSR